eukprot:gene4102-8157_t
MPSIFHLISRMSPMPIMLAILLVGSLIPIIPLFTGYSLNVGDDFDVNDHLPSFLDELVNTPKYHSALVASISACAPILLESLFDVINRQNRPALEKYIPRREIFFIIVLPDIFILVYLLPYRQFDWLAGVVTVRDTLFNYAFLHYLYNLCPHIWTKFSMLTVASCVMLVNAFEIYSIMNVDEDLESICDILTRLFVCIAAFILIPLYFKWFKYSSAIEDTTLRRKMQFCQAYAIVYAIFFIAVWSTVFVADSDKSWGCMCGANFITMYTYVTGASAILLSLSNVNDIKVSAHIALSILNDMLLLDKVSSGTLLLDKTLFDPWTAVKDTIQSMMIQSREIGVEIKYGSEDILPGLLQNYVIDGDKAKLDQVIRNLLSNALKFTPQGKCIHINIDIHEQPILPSQKRLDKLFRMVQLHPPLSTYEKFLRVQVIDEGVGISTEDQQKLFRQEIHFSPGELQNGGGTGIGLLTGTDQQHPNGFESTTTTPPTADAASTASYLNNAPTREFLRPPSSTATATGGQECVVDPVVDVAHHSVSVYVSVTVSSSGLTMTTTSTTTTTITSISVSSTALIVDYSNMTRKMMVRTFKSNYECTEAIDGLQAIEMCTFTTKIITASDKIMYFAKLIIYFAPTITVAVLQKWMCLSFTEGCAENLQSFQNLKTIGPQATRQMGKITEYPAGSEGTELLYEEVKWKNQACGQDKWLEDGE